MPKSGRWKEIFGQSKPKVPVQVGDKAETMTVTQAYRFDELSQPDDAPPANQNPLDQPMYSLTEAAFRLMVSEADLLKRAASGAVKLYTNAAGLEGRWRRMGGDGKTVESSSRKMRCGYLELTALSCIELSTYGATDVLVFELPNVPDPSALKLDAATLQELSAWGSEKKCFCVREPCRVGSDEVFLLAPLK